MLQLQRDYYLSKKFEVREVDLFPDIKVFLDCTLGKFVRPKDIVGNPLQKLFFYTNEIFNGSVQWGEVSHVSLQSKSKRGDPKTKFLRLFLSAARRPPIRPTIKNFT